MFNNFFSKIAQGLKIHVGLGQWLHVNKTANHLQKNIQNMFSFVLHVATALILFLM